MKKTQWQHGVSALLLSALLGGCASFGPDSVPASQLNAEQLRLANKQGGQLASDWWTQLNDAALNQLVASALQDAPSLKLAEARLRQARAAVGIVEGNSGPKLDFSANMTQLNYEFPAPISRDYVNAYTAMLMGSWEFDFWGKHRGQIDEAVGQQTAIAFEGAQTRLTLTQAVIAQYTQLQRLQAQSAVLAKRIQLAESRQTLIQARINAGLLPGDNQRGNEVSLHRLRQQQSALAQDSDRARHALAALTGQGPDALRDLQPGKALTVPAMDADGLNADLLGKRPDIAAQRARVEAMAGAVKAARAEFYPNIKLTAFAGQTSLEFNKLMNGDSSFWGFMPAISLPIFHSGAIQANLGKQRASYDMAVLSYNQTVLDALRDAADAVSGWQQSGKQLEQAHQAQDSSLRAADSAGARFKAGIINKLNLLDAQDSALAQQSARIDAEAGRKLAWTSLNTALGGGFTAAPATH